MKIKVSDYIAEYFAANGIKTVFTVVGGGAMHLNDSLGHHPALHCVYNHHEQASAMAAEAYFRVNNEMAGLCVTSGPGAINALNGVAGAYQDSIPMIVVSGQTKSTLMTCNSGLDLRTLGNQEFDIISALGKMTKYAVTLMSPTDVCYELEKAFYLAKNGRPGPCWIEVPVDVQGAFVELSECRHYNAVTASEGAMTDSDPCVSEKIEMLLTRLKEAKRPIIYAGNGIRISGGKELLHEMVEKTGIPVATCWDSIDLMETEDPHYVGRAGIMGDRPGNFAVQNSDFLIAIGNRLNIYQVGYQLESWARAAYVADVDIDTQELQKKTIRIDLPICCDASVFMSRLLTEIEKSGFDAKDNFAAWLAQCLAWKEKYPVVQMRHYEQESPLNVYAAIDMISRKLPEGMVTVAANGSASVVGSAAYYIGKNQRFLMNCAISSMGYDLPAAVGASTALGKGAVVCLAGDGSIMMNLQELQTIVTNGLPVKIVLINNNGYQQIRLTQTNLFHKNFVGIGADSGDLGFPDFGRVADAFGIPYKRCDRLSELEADVDWMLTQPAYCLLEICCTTDQAFEPKSATKRLDDGRLISPPLEDLAPFLPREELEENMYIPMWEKE